MSLGDYLVGVLGLAAVVAPLALAAVRARRRLLPGWEGAPARLAEAVLGISALTVLLQLLGAVGILTPLTLVAASLAVGAGTLILLQPPTEEAPAPSAPAIPPLHMALALIAAVFVATHWAAGLQDVWARGILIFDSVWYHGPFAARIAETGDASALHFTDPLYLNWFYPENSELQHATGILFFGNDLLSPLLNFGWLGLALLSAWCIGRPYGVAPLSLVAVALILDTGPMIPREAGSMANDIAPIAMLLAAAALLVNGTAAGRATDGAGVPSRPPGLPVVLLAGLAAGLALGTKMTIAVAVAALAVGVALVAPKGARRRIFGVFVGGVAITAGFWFLRNLLHGGNPLPWFGELGPLDLPGPGRGLEGREPFSVAHYILENPSADVWRSYFLDGIRDLLGPLWFLILGGKVAGALVSLIWPRSATVRMLGAVAVVAAVAYAFTPLTAAGPEGQPDAFVINFRYLLAALALALALLPLALPAGESRVRLPGSREGVPADRLQLGLLIAALAAIAVTANYSDSGRIWDDPHTSIPFALLIGIVLVGVPAGIAGLWRRSPTGAALAGGLVALAVVGVGYERQDDYLDDRYAGGEGFQHQLDDAVRWANPTSGLRIGVAGTSGAYNQYGFYGTDLDNHVQFIGEEGSAGDFTAIEKCRPWRTALNAGDYDYVVTSPALDLNDATELGPTPERGWLLGAPQVQRILQSGRVAVFEISGDLDPDGCGRRPAQ